MSEGDTPSAPALTYVSASTPSAACVAARSWRPRASCTQQWPVSVKLHRQVSTQMAASLPARWRICCRAVPTNSAAKLRLDFCAGTGNNRNWRTPAARSFSNWVSSDASVCRELPGSPPSGSSLVNPSARNSGWISWFWPKPISDTMSRNGAVARSLCSRFIASILTPRHVKNVTTRSRPLFRGLQGGLFRIVDAQLLQPGHEPVVARPELVRGQVHLPGLLLVTAFEGDVGQHRRRGRVGLELHRGERILLG